MCCLLSLTRVPDTPAHTRVQPARPSPHDASQSSSEAHSQAQAHSEEATAHTIQPHVDREAPALDYHVVPLQLTLWYPPGAPFLEVGLLGQSSERD